MPFCLSAFNHHLLTRHQPRHKPLSLHPTGTSNKPSLSTLHLKTLLPKTATTFQTKPTLHPCLQQPLLQTSPHQPTVLHPTTSPTWFAPSVTFRTTRTATMITPTKTLSRTFSLEARSLVWLSRTLTDALRITSVTSCSRLESMLYPTSARPTQLTHD
jgi:hypothetical protein